jgi:negative regulator of flagellin synthesis FlgM
MPDPIQGVSTPDAVAPTSTPPTGTTPNSDAAASAPASTTASTDVADVTQTEALLQSIISEAAKVPGADQAKIASLQQAIASGAYQVNPQSIAQKIAELEVLLGTAGQVQ